MTREFYDKNTHQPEQQCRNALPMPLLSAHLRCMLLAGHDHHHHFSSYDSWPTIRGHELPDAR